MVVDNRNPKRKYCSRTCYDAHRPSLSAEVLAKLSVAMMGDTSPMKCPAVAAKSAAARKGKGTGDRNAMKRPEVAAKKAATMIGPKNPQWGKRGLKSPMWGQHHSAETINKIREVHIGKLRSAESKARQSASTTGNKNHRWGKHHTPEAVTKQADAKKGSKNPSWLGGISREPYGWEWNDELREEVRRRDGHQCQLCGAPQAECKRKLDVHHIDYDKKNSDPVNLVALCVFCNLKVNANRQHWTAHFQAMAIERDIATMRRNKQPGQET